MKRLRSEIGIDLALSLIAIAAIYWAVSGFGVYQPSHKLRATVGEAWEKNGFSIALVWPLHGDLSFIEGAKLALEENNAAHNALSQRIRLRMFTETDRDDGTRVAQQVASYRDVVAVLGHEFSSSAIDASLVYENHGILFIAPNSTSPRLTTHGFQFVFRMTPDDHAIASALVRFAKGQAFSKLAVLYARTALGESLAPSLVSQLAKQGMELTFYRSYLPLEDWRHQDFRAMIADLIQKPFDAILLVDQLPRAARLVSDLRRMGLRQPILGGDKLDSPQLWEIAGQAADGLYAVSAVDTSTQTPGYVAFRQSFSKRYGVEPGYGASQGYESVRLLIEAVLESKSADPIVLATTLRVGKWKGIFGPFSFSRHGDIVGRSLSTKRMNDGIFASVPSAKEPSCCRP
jgi:branched-chain amino acid transport system substrate-binding protein